MTVIVLAVCPPGLRGHLTRWMIEVAPGIYVGTVTSRVRELLWTGVVDMCGKGRALMVHSTSGEQRLTFRSHNHSWQPIDYDGLTLMLRPAQEQPDGSDSRDGQPKPGWSAAAKRRRFGGSR